MDFGDCLKMLKQGKRMARAGWNGKGMFIYLVEGYNVPTDEWWIKTPAQEPTAAEKEKGFITIKGIGSASGASRYEWEKEIPVAEVEELLKICEPGVIDKTRYLVEAGEHTYEVDEFYGDNEGLTVAEVELSSEDEAFAKPEWLGEEVTGDVKYYNSMLMKNPYKNWAK